MLQLGKNTRSSTLILAGIVLVIILFFAFAIHFIMADNIVGNDILVFYLAAKSSFIDGLGPYLSENAVISQVLSYGKPAQPGEDYLTFSYPPYALIPIWILTFLPFDWAQALWMASLIIGFVLGLYLIFPQAPKWLAPFALIIYPVAFGILMGNFVIPITIILLLNINYFFFNNNKRNQAMEYVLAISLAWATVKPQFSWLFIAFILASAFSQKKRKFIFCFFLSLIVLLLLSFLIQPDWVSAFIKQISFYQQTNPTELQLIKFLNLFLPVRISGIIAIPLIVIAILWVFYAFYLWWQKKLKTLLVFIIIGWVSYLLYPGGVDYQQIVFVLPFLLWIFQWKPTKPILVTIVWVFLILFSWLEFFYVRILGMNPGFTGWLFYGYLLWAVFLLSQKEKASDPIIAEHI